MTDASNTLTNEPRRPMSAVHRRARRAAAPAGAAGTCSDFYCGGISNHNEAAGRDRRRASHVRPALGRLALAAGAVPVIVVATADSAHAGFTMNHNEAAGRDGRS